MGNKIPPTPRDSLSSRPQRPDEEETELINRNSFKLANKTEIDISINSKIYKTFDDTEKNWYILKSIHVDNDENRKLAKFEANILFNLNHNNIVKSHRFFESSNYICIVMENCSKGNLRKKLQGDTPLSED
ncbi:unnamed protein product [Blepharisma stoltei]|uniref:non-specific serine/threonine protein kinase n=1 Tax=Blepharisma stoltei TaxID=1481888 RepID=A0AAU9J380_9CILI|nr:unnamed protein product [Blepharisma stoltei]